MLTIVLFVVLFTGSAGPQASAIVAVVEVVVLVVGSVLLRPFQCNSANAA